MLSFLSWNIASQYWVTILGMRSLEMPSQLSIWTLVASYGDTLKVREAINKNVYWKGSCGLCEGISIR